MQKNEDKSMSNKTEKETEDLDKAEYLFEKRSLTIDTDDLEFLYWWQVQLEEMHAAVVDIVMSSYDIKEARKRIFAMEYSLIKETVSEYEPRIVPAGNLDKAKYILKNLHKDYSQYVACVQYNKEHRQDKPFTYYGLSKAEFFEIRNDIKTLRFLMQTTLKEYADLIRDMFFAGLSYQEYANKYLPDKKKATAAYKAEILFKALGDEYERLQLAEVDERKQKVMQSNSVGKDGKTRPAKSAGAALEQAYFENEFGENSFDSFSESLRERKETTDEE